MKTRIENSGRPFSIFLFLILPLIAAADLPAQTTLIFSDNFNTGTIDGNKWRRGTNAGNQSSVISHQLELRSQGSENGWILTRNKYKAQNTTVSVKVVQPGDDGDIGMSPNYSMSNKRGIYNQKNWYRFYTSRPSHTGPYRLIVQWKKNNVLGGNLDVTGNLVITSQSGVYLRLRFNNTNIYFDASFDGVNWVNTYTEVFSLPGYTLNTSFYYELAAYNTTSNGVMTADDFAIRTLDTQSPTISSVAASNLTASTAMISWTTNEAADSQVEYGLTTSYGSVTTLNPSLVTSHAVALVGLQANTLYHYRVKSRDAAGNFATSGDFTFTTLSSDVTPPIISNVVASNITISAATISWATNETSDSQVEYGLTTSYGSVTALNPSPVTSHSVLLSGLQANTLYHYRVKSKDAARNLATSGDFTFSTDVTAPIISNVAASNITISAATITWTTNEAADSQVEYGLTTSYGSVTTLDPALVTAHSVALAGLQSNTLYHYRVKSKDAAGNLATSGDFTFSTDVTAPIISNVAANNITGSAATISWATNEAADSQVEYGLTTSYGSVTTLDPALVTSHSVVLAGLQSNALYHYRVKSKDAAGNLATSGDFTFSTDVTPPIISNVVASNITISAATISWATNEAADSQVEYGLTTSYGAVTTLDPALVTSHSVALAGLQANALYHYRVKSKDAAGNLATSGDFTFSADVTAPIISNVAANNITISAATISWATNEAADSQVEYGLTTSYGSVTTLDPALVTSHSVALAGLQSNTLYHYRVKSKDAAGNLATSGDFTFSTDVTSPIISNVAASNITISAATISWATNEGADSQVEYGLTTSYGSVTTLDPALVTAHSVALAVLQANTLYHYRVKSKDAAGNLATSGDFTFTTLSSDVTPPIISNVVASNITISAATISWATNETSDSQVEYGLTTSYGAVTPVDPAPVTSHSVALSGLQANTLYHYHVKSKDAVGNLATSGDFTFTTASATPPFDVTLEAENMPIKTNGDARPPGWVLWEDGYLAQNVTFTGSGLHQFTLRAFGIYAAGEWSQAELRIDQVPQAVISVNASEYTDFPVAFTVTAGTHEVAIAFINDLYDPPDNRNLYVDWLRIQSAGPADTQPPIISGVAANNVTTSSATIVWTTDEASDSQVEYGLTANYGSVSPLGSTLLTNHAVSLSNLQANTIYHYRVKSKDAAGNLATSGDFTFSTGGSGSGNVAFANVQDLFNGNCVRCHQGATAPGGLVLLPGQAHGNIVNVTSTEYPAWQRVQPGNRAVSWLYEKITNTAPPVGSKMGSLSADEIELIGNWIDQGATATPVPPYANLQFRTTALVNGEINIAYGLSLVVWGGLPPYQFSVAGGALPPGLELDPSSGMIFGVPTATGSYNFVIRVGDSRSPAATLDQAYGLEIFNTRDHWQLPSGFVVENVVSDLHLPVNIAFVPNPGPNPTDPYFYVTLLYGEIVMVPRNFQKQTYATGLLNFSPTGDFPGSGEMGVIGITVDPLSGDVFASMVFDSSDGEKYDKVMRYHSTDGGRTAATSSTILYGIPSGVSHQIQALTIGPDGKLYVNIGDGWQAQFAPDLNDLRGKILRLNLDGSMPPDNPYNYVYASGIRNPFGAAWRPADGKLYISDNGPTFDDRLVKVLPGQDYGWNLTSPDLTIGALYLWNPTVSPVGMDFGDRTSFPSEYRSRLFVGLAGGPYDLGYHPLAKKIQQFDLDNAGNMVSASTFLDYVGAGRATVVGVAAGPDGLYFTDLFGENGFDQFGQTQANVYRIRWGTADVTPPVIANVQATNVTGTSATIVWQTDEPSTRQVEYGLTTNYGLSTPPETNLLTNHSVTLSQLTPETTYHFHVIGIDAANNPAISADFTFTTTVIDVTPPVISAVHLDSIAVTSALVKWTTNEPSSSFVDFGTTTGYGATKSSPQLVTAHRVPLTGLADSTLYHFRVRSLDASGNSAASADGAFTTRHNHNPQIDVTLEAENMPIKTNGDARPPGWVLFENGYVAQNLNFPATGSYRFTLRANGQEALGEWSMAEIRLNQAAKAVIEINGGNYADFVVEFTVAAGTHEVAVAFINDLDDPPYGRNLYVDRLRIQNSGVVKSRFTETASTPLPEKFVLQSYPNPFNAATRIRFDLPQAAEIEVKIFDLAGRELLDLASDERAAGSHEVIWNGRGRNGNELSSGVYLVRLRYRGDKNGAWSQLLQRVLMVK